MLPLIVPAFLDPDTCRRVRRAMDAGTPEPAEVLGESVQRDDAVRHATLIEVDARTLAWLEQRVGEARPLAARHFGVSLTGREGLGIVRYPPGGFFKPHRDRGEVPSWPAASHRRTAVVVFLNSSRDVDANGDFAGGALRLFDDEAEEWREVHPEAGMLVAFPATTLHEVTAVGDGVRDAIVDWFS